MIVGFTNGCFQLFHEGHQFFLTECRKHCDYLIVALNTDESIRRLKGADHVFEPLATRMAHVRTMAEAVIPFEGREEMLIMEIRPNVVLKGSDHSPNQTHYAQRVPGWKNGPHGIWSAPVVHIKKLEGYSTTMISDAIRAAKERIPPVA